MERKRRYLLFCHAFSGCDTVLAIAGRRKTTRVDRFCTGDIDEHMDIFLDVKVIKDMVIEAGITIFKYIYYAPCITLGAIRYQMFSRRQRLGDQTRDSTSNRRCSCTAFSPCISSNPGLDTFLQSMSSDPSNYGWTVGAQVMNQFQH